MIRETHKQPNSRRNHSDDEQTDHDSSGGDLRLYLSVQEVHELTGLSVNTVRRLIRQKKLPSWQPGGPGGRLLVPRDAVEGTIDTSPEPPPQEAREVPPSKLSRLSGPPAKWRKSLLNQE